MNYEKYKEAQKRASKRYYLKHKAYYKKLHRKWFQKNYHKIKEQNKIRKKLWIASHKEWSNDYHRMAKSWLAPEQIPELEYYGCVSDLNYQIEKGGYINGSKC